jgi:phage terminase small subunit
VEQELEEGTRYLPQKRRLFIEYYLGRANGNASEAARLAGYASPGAEGCRLLKDAEIQAEVSKRVKEAAMGADEVLARLADHARVSISDFIELYEDGTWRFNLKKAEEAGKLHLIAEMGKGRQGEKLKLVDAQSALEKLGRHHKLFTDRVEADLNVGMVIGYDVGLPDETEYDDSEPGEDCSD